MRLYFSLVIDKWVSRVLRASRRWAIWFWSSGSSLLRMYLFKRIMIFSSTSGTCSNSWSWSSSTCGAHVSLIGMDSRHSLIIRSFGLYHLTVGEICTAEKVKVLDVSHLSLQICAAPDLCHDLTLASLTSGLQLGLPVEHSMGNWKVQEKIGVVFLPSVLSWQGLDFGFVLLYTKAITPACQNPHQSSGNMPPCPF